MAKKNFYTVIGSFDNFTCSGQECAKTPKKALKQFLADFSPEMLKGHGLGSREKVRKWLKKVQMNSDNQMMPSVWGDAFKSKKGRYIYFKIVHTLEPQDDSS